MENKIRITLSRDLRKKYGIRSFPVVNGDVVTITSGTRKGEGGKVDKVDHRARRISVDGITISKADGKQEQYLLPTNIFRITRLDLSSPGRLEKIRELAARKNIVVEEEPEPAAPEPETIEGEEASGEQAAEQGEAEENEEEPEEEESAEGETEEESEEPAPEEPGKTESDEEVQSEAEEESQEEVKKDD